jgi:hypothetical protein
MTLEELLEHNKKAQVYQDSLPIEQQIELLKQYKKSVFTFHMEDGRKLVRGDSESDKTEMQDFFAKHPQTGCKWIEFHD